MQKKQFDVLKEEKNCIMKILDYLKDYKMQNPFTFLKKTSIGKLIKYIITGLPNGGTKEAFEEVFKNIEEQVLSQLFQKVK